MSTDHLLPEELARKQIDRELEAAGWQVADRDTYAGKDSMPAAAIREAMLRNHREADYVLLLNGKAAAVIEAKRAEIRLDDPRLIAQAEQYTELLPEWYPSWKSPIKLIYLSNGREIAFKDCSKPNAQYEIIPRFHRPKDIAKILGLTGEFDSLPTLFQGELRDCQFQAIKALEASFKAGKRRALMVLATGAGKTFTACMIAYRMLAYTPAKRVLFLVDRNNLGVAAVTEFQSFKLTESEKSFSSIYGVAQLRNRPVDPDTRVVVSTIQRLYSQLGGNHDSYSEEEEDASLGHEIGSEVDLPENPQLPPDFFDLIIIDECHRSIYSDWQKVLTYFKTARLVGMTATPIPETVAFFDKNVVANYTLEKSIVDGVNVMGRIYRIKTLLGEEGGEINVGDKLDIISRRDFPHWRQTAIIDRPITPSQLSRTHLVRDQIRKVIEEYKSAVYTKFYPDREANFDWLPKTLIFAANEAHARMIVEVVKEVFERTDNKFVQRITYSCEDSNALIRSFRNDVDFRVAVTVTLVATGTDVRPLEVLIFMTDVHSETLYTQMKGRGVRTIAPSLLHSVTPNAYRKDLFYLIDAVGVTESEKVVPSVDGDDDRPINLTLELLLEKMALGVVPDDYLQLLASKLSTLANRADPEDIQDFEEFSRISLTDLAERIFDALEKETLPPFISASEDNTERLKLIDDLISNIPARKKLISIARGYVKEVLEKTDEVISAGFSLEDAQASAQAFEKYVTEHRDEIEALRLIYNQETGRLTYPVIDDLRKKLETELTGFSSERLWRDYGLLQPDKVKALPEKSSAHASEREALTNLIQLVRFAYRITPGLYALTSTAASRFELWCGQAQRNIEMTPEQKEVFRKIAAYIAVNGCCPDISSLRDMAPEFMRGLLQFLKPQAANEALFSLSEFILKAA